jgi:hypothetical protein
MQSSFLPESSQTNCDISFILEGLCQLKEVQDSDLPPALHYIRYIAEIPLSTMTAHDEDDSNDTSEVLRVIICMSRESSQRLLAAQYLQSDIAFKRVAGFLEFEIGHLDQNAKIGLSVYQLRRP